MGCMMRVEAQMPIETRRMAEKRLQRNDIIRDAIK